jgi:hypothetical protein
MGVVGGGLMYKGGGEKVEEKINVMDGKGIVMRCRW